MVKTKNIEYEWMEFTGFFGGASFLTMFIYGALYFSQ